MQSEANHLVSSNKSAMLLCVFVQLRRGSILAYFTVSAPANQSDDTAIDLLSVSRFDCLLT